MRMVVVGASVCCGIRQRRRQRRVLYQFKVLWSRRLDLQRGNALVPSYLKEWLLGTVQAQKLLGRSTSIAKPLQFLESVFRC